MNHWLILPILFPAFVAATQILAHRHLTVQRGFALAIGTLTLIMLVWMFVRVRDLGIETYHPGHFLSPAGSVLVLDRLAITFLLLTNVLGLFALASLSAIGLDRQQRHLHPQAQFLLMGLNGSFLAGDLFTLFLFMEAAVIAATGLMLRSGSRGQPAARRFLRSHLWALALFSVAIGGLYSLTGTLTLADLAEKAAALHGPDQALLSATSLLLFGGMAQISGLFPFHPWLRTSLTSAPAPIALLIAALPLAGAYAILRLFTQILPDPPLLPWLLAAALATGIAGLIGGLRSTSLAQLAVEALLVGNAGVFATMAVATEPGAAAALILLVPASLGSAALILLVGALQGGNPVLTLPSRPFALLLLLAGLSVTGAPPFAGFLARLMALKAAFHTQPLLLVPFLLVAPALCLLAFLRHLLPLPDPLLHTGLPQPATAGLRPPILPVALAAALLLLSLSLLPFAFPVLKFLRGTADHLYMKTEYINAVLGLP